MTILFLLFTCHGLSGIHHYYIIKGPFASLNIIYSDWNSESCLILLLPSVRPLTPFKLQGVAMSMCDTRARLLKGVLLDDAVWITEVWFF